MKDTDPWFYAAMIAASGVLILGFSLLATAKDQREIKAQAVKHGYATWEADEHGNTTFTWKQP